jgi:hypothetical protein
MKSNEANEALFRDVLGVVVPVAIDEMREWNSSDRAAVAHASADILANGGTSVFAKVSITVDAAKLFAVLTRAIAAGAYQPGGIEFLGMRFQA